MSESDEVNPPIPVYREAYPRHQMYDLVFKHKCIADVDSLRSALVSQRHQPPTRAPSQVRWPNPIVPYRGFSKTWV